MKCFISLYCFDLCCSPKKILLHCSVFFCDIAVLYVVLCCIDLNSSVLVHVILCCVVLHSGICTVFHCVILCCFILLLYYIV